MVFAIALSFSLANNPEASLLSILLASIVPSGVFLFVQRIAVWIPDWRLFRLVSFSGFSMYLFHRPIFQILKSVYFPGGVKYQIPYLLFIGTPLIFVISWAIQRFYDRFVLGKLMKTIVSRSETSQKLRVEDSNDDVY